jgi:hypothetical protein
MSIYRRDFVHRKSGTELIFTPDAVLAKEKDPVARYRYVLIDSREPSSDNHEQL